MNDFYKQPGDLAADTPLSGNPPAINIDDIDGYMSTPSKSGSFINIITVQAIICTLVMIAAVLLGTFAPDKLEFFRKKYQTMVTADAKTFFKRVDEKYKSFIEGFITSNTSSSQSSDFSSKQTSSKEETSSEEKVSSAPISSAENNSKKASSATTSSKGTSSAASKSKKKASSKAPSLTGTFAAGGIPTPISDLKAAPSDATVLPVNVTIPLTRPLDTGRVSSFFGRRIHPITNQYEFHTGLDIAAAKNSPVYAIADGVVVKSKSDKTIGNFIYIKHADGFSSKYGHLSKRLVKKGDKVKAGQVIGRVGTTGLSTGYHLHLEMMKDKISFNPLFVFNYD